MEKRTINTNLTYAETKSLIEQALKEGKSFEISHQKEEVDAYIEDGKLHLYEGFQSDLYDKNERNWNVRILDSEVSDEDTNGCKDVSLTELKETIALLANKYTLDTIWNKFKVTNSDNNYNYNIAILSAPGEDYRADYVEIENDNVRDVNSYMSFNLTDKEKLSKNWKIEFVA